MSPTSTRYRVEGDRHCVDIRVRSPRQLFDLRDPAPFRVRDLDEDAVDYVVGALEELPGEPVRIVIHVGEPEPSLPDEVVVDAVRAHFQHERALVTRRIRRMLRHGRTTLGIGVAVLVALLSLAELVAASSLPPQLRQIVREGLVISGWVALWRPLELLFYDWWPLLDRRRLYDRILDASIEVRAEGASPPAA